MNELVHSTERRYRQWSTGPFRSEGRIVPALVAAFVIVNGVVLTNAVLHDPAVGYDSRDHLLYILTLSEFRLPTREDTTQFFSPPLPYFPPALFAAAGFSDYAWFGKFAQLANVAYSCVLCFYLLRICELTRPGEPRLKLASLSLLGILPAYYKTFAMVRGEPLLAALATVCIYQALALFLKKDFSVRRAATLGISLGLAVLARQWGFFLFPALALWVGLLCLKQCETRRRCLKAFALSLVISFAVGGWFYLRHHFKFGSVQAFNRSGAAQFSLANQPHEFYLSLGLEKLFQEPVRESFTNQLFPKFYSELWGDHECYFLVYGWNRLKGQYLSGWQLAAQLNEGVDPSFFQTNRADMARYLGRVNLLALFPTTLLLLGFFSAGLGFLRGKNEAGEDDSNRALLLLWLTVLCSAVGYLWFLIQYPNLKGDTIKASYLLQVFPCVAVLGAGFLEKFRARSSRARAIIWLLLGLVTVHNVPAFFTRYVPWR